MSGHVGVQAARLTPPEVALRRALRGLAASSAAFLAFYLWVGVFDEAEFAFGTNSVAKDTLLVALCLAAAGDVRRFGWITSLVIVVHAVLAACLALFGLLHEPSIAATLHNPLWNPPEWLWVWGWFASDVLVVAFFLRLYTRSQRARYGLQYLGNGEFLALSAMSEVLNERRNATEPTPQEVAKAVDGYLAGFSAHGKAKLRLALAGLTWYPLLTANPPLWMMDRDDRLRFVRKRFLEDVSERRGLAWWRRQRQSMIRGAAQLCYLGFYRDPAVARSCGYEPLSSRPEGAAVRRNGRPSLRCLTPADLRGDVLEADVVVIGSGAGGATVAAQLAARGREVLVLERGRHVDPADFSEDELAQFSALYADGALTLSSDFRFQVLQGMCVGGSTVVNNAVCFDLPDRVLDEWLDRDGFDCGLDAGELRGAFARLRRDLPVVESTKAAWSPGWQPFQQGAVQLRMQRRQAGLPDLDVRPVSCNVVGCVGCGLCNTGCAYGAKLSMLDGTLPAAQAAHPDGLQVLADCRVDRIERRGSRVTGVTCTLADGSRLDVHARDVVVSAGALASSVLLQRSGLGGDQAGRGVAFNLGVPMTAEFPQRIGAHEGLSITHYLEPPPEAGYVLETWFQPIVSMSLFMPGWFDEHERNMRHYDHMACVGAVVASSPDGVVRPTRSPRSLKLRYTPSQPDLRRLRDGMKMAGRVLLAGGATRVMPPSFRFHEYRTAAELERLPGDLQDTSDVSVNSSHPQGGNRMSQTSRDGVVDPDFRVHGIENLYVCDASVFPSAITVNPQLTVMALGLCAAERVA